MSVEPMSVFGKGGGGREIERKARGEKYHKLIINSICEGAKSTAIKVWRFHILRSVLRTLQT